MTATVSMIPYANMAPYHRLGRPAGVRFVEKVPRQSVEALRRGEIVAAAVPVGALPLLGDTVEALGAFGIAAEKAVGSVFLFSRRSVDALRRPRSVYLTSQSATSIRLLYLILGYVNGFDAIPYVTADETAADGHLLIGDDAIRRAKSGGDPFVYDLVTEWDRHHRLPFVFARWVVRKDASVEVKQRLKGWLEGLIGNDDRFIEESAPAEAARVGLTVPEMVAYLKGMKRILGPAELEGQARFLAEIATRVPPPPVRPDPGLPPGGRRASTDGHG